MNSKKVRACLLGIIYGVFALFNCVGAAELADSQNNEMPKTEFTLEEIQSGMAEGILDDFVMAVKKGDVFYIDDLLDSDDYRIRDIGSSSEWVYIGQGPVGEEPYWTYPEISLSAGDQIVIFNSEEIDYSIGLYKVVQEVYCLPFFFQYDKKEDGMIVGEPVNRSYADSYAGDIMDASYPSGAIIEVDGMEFTEDLLWENNLICGEYNQEITLGGFEGTAYKEYVYKCDRPGYLYETREKATGIAGKPAKLVKIDYGVSTDQAKLTKEGYAVYMDKEVNTVEPGTYVLSGCLITITE